MERQKLQKDLFGYMKALNNNAPDKYLIIIC